MESWWDQVGSKVQGLWDRLGGAPNPQEAANAQLRQQQSDALVSVIPTEHQAAVRQALTAVYQARDQVAQNSNKDTLGIQAKAEKELADVLLKAADAHEKNAAKQYDPDQKAAWQAQADSLRAHAAEAQQRTALLGSKDATEQANIQSQIEARTHAASLADARLAIAQAKSPAEIERAVAQSQASIALAQQRNTLTPALLAEHNARADELVSRSKYYDGRAILTRAQIDQAEARGDLSSAQADQIRMLGPIKAADLQARTGWNNAKVQQVVAGINKWVALPGADRYSPVIVQQQPSTGEIRGVPNPGYVNTLQQGLTDTEQAIQTVQQQMADGQMSVADGTALLNNLRQALQFRAQGVTPDQYVQQQTERARMGAQMLQSRVSAGTGMLDSLMRGAMGSKMLSVPPGLGQGLASGIQDWVTQLGGGQDVYNTAAQLVKNLAAPGDNRDLGAATAAITQALQMHKDATGEDHPLVDKVGQLGSGTSNLAGSGIAGQTQTPSDVLLSAARPTYAEPDRNESPGGGTYFQPDRRLLAGAR